MVLHNSSKKHNAPDMLMAAKELMNLGKLVILKPGDKVPMTPHGVKDATNDIATFKRLMPKQV